MLSSKRVLSNVGGIFLNDMKVTSGVPRYEVVPKARQRQAMLWCLIRQSILSNMLTQALSVRDSWL